MNYVPNTNSSSALCQELSFSLGVHSAETVCFRSMRVCGVSLHWPSELMPMLRLGGGAGGGADLGVALHSHPYR